MVGRDRVILHQLVSIMHSLQSLDGFRVLERSLRRRPDCRVDSVNKLPHVGGVGSAEQHAHQRAQSLSEDSQAVCLDRLERYLAGTAGDRLGRL